MQIHLLRAPEPDLPPDVCYGQLDVPARPGSWQDIVPLTDRHTKDWSVVSSPHSTAQALAERLAQGAEVVYDAAWLELSFGRWEGKRWDELDQQELHTWMRNYDVHAPPHGESLHVLQKRVLQAWEPLLQRPAAHVYVVTHKGPILVVLAELLGISYARALSFEVDFVTETRFRWDNGQVRVLGVNLLL